ncbi:NAD(P)H-binding protein [Pseudomonas sp. R2.Fl]|nr:NAD(P)H-binding protein [Pseudomonas sp. R2.Fl]
MTETKTALTIDSPLALVLGATGGIGGAVAARLRQRGYRVRAMHRNAAAMAPRAPDYQWVAGDATNRDDVIAAAAGASLIVHAVNPPGYRNWGTLVLPMIDNTIAAAKAAGARILMPGTIYNYGPDSFPLIGETSPQNPVTVKGGIRVELERRLEKAASEGVPVLIVRAGDYFGPGAGNTWFTQVVVKPGKPVAAITNPADRGVGHQWAYLPDVAETMARLLEEADRLPAFARFHMDGFFDRDGSQLAASIRRVTGSAELKVKRFPWSLVRLSSPFVPLFRELIEMRYLWKQAVRLDNAALVDFLGEEPQTPIDEAIRATLRSIGCLPAGEMVQRGRASGITVGEARA